MGKEEINILIDVVKNSISENIQKQFNSFKEEMNNFKEEIRSEMNDFKEEMRAEMNSFKDEIRNEMNNFKEEIKSEIIPRIDNLEKTQNELKEDIQKLRNSMFIFEHEYGRKIDALYDWRELEIEKERKNVLEREKITKRMDNFDIISWQHEKRISNLEKKCQN